MLYWVACCSILQLWIIGYDVKHTAIQTEEILCLKLKETPQGNYKT